MTSIVVEINDMDTPSCRGHGAGLFMVSLVIYAGRQGALMEMPTRRWSCRRLMRCRNIASSAPGLASSARHGATPAGVRIKAASAASPTTITASDAAGQLASKDAAGDNFLSERRRPAIGALAISAPLSRKRQGHDFGIIRRRRRRLSDAART